MKPIRLICPVCDKKLTINYDFIYACENRDCEMNELILMVNNTPERIEMFHRVSRWIRTGREIEASGSKGADDEVD